MKPGQLRDVLTEIILHTDITPLIWGSRGIGKSRIVASLTKHLSALEGQLWGLVDLRISTQEISDLTGLPRPISWRATDLGCGEKALITETSWSVPSWFPTAEKVSQPTRGIPEKGIIFLDEINRGGHQETQAIFQFVLDRRIHTHVLAPGWKIIAAANPPTEEYLVNELDSALLDRFLHLNLKPDSEDWLAWANSEEGSISPAVSKFIKTYPEMLYEMSEAEQNWVPIRRSSPRSWEAVDTILKKCRIPAEQEVEVLAGLIGNIPALSLKEYLTKEFSKPIKAEEILTDYPKVRSVFLHLVEQKRLDQINIITQDLTEMAQANPDQFNVDNFFAFFLDLPKDLKVTLLDTLINNEAIYKMINNHEQLVQEVTAIITEVERC